MGERKTVVVTGACGYIASLMLPQLRERYDLVYAPHNPHPPAEPASHPSPCAPPTPLHISLPRRLLDVVPPSQAKPSAAVRPDATAGLTVHIADLSSPNLDVYRHHFTGAHAVIHLGFGGAMGTEASLTGPKWDSEYANVGMAHNVYQVSLESVPSPPPPPPCCPRACCCPDCRSHGGRHTQI